MESVVLVIHLILALAIITVVLLQRSEGGGLGIGGGGLGNLATARSTANALTRLTAILAACFMGTSLLLAIIAGSSGPSGSIMDVIEAENAAVTVQEEGGNTAPDQAQSDHAKDEDAKIDAEDKAASEPETQSVDGEPSAPISK